MKRVSVYILSIMLVLILSACSGSTGDIDDKRVADDKIRKEENGKDAVDGGNISEKDTAAENTSKKSVSIDKQVIYEGNNIRVTATGLNYDDFLGPSVSVLIENDSNRNITVQTRKTSVNGVMVETVFSSDVAAGKKANDSITFLLSDLKNAAIDIIKDIEFSLHISDTDTWDSITDTQSITLHTTVDASYVQEYDDSGFIAYEDNNIKIVVKKLNSSDSFWGSDVYLYIENNSNKDITVQARDVSINGFMVEPVFSSDIAAGKKAYDTITFMESDLKNNNITDIEEMELKFHIFDMDSWDTIKDTDAVKISFK